MKTQQSRKNKSSDSFRQDHEEGNSDRQSRFSSTASRRLVPVRMRNISSPFPLTNRTASLRVYHVSVGAATWHNSAITPSKKWRTQLDLLPERQVETLNSSICSISCRERRIIRTLYYRCILVHERNVGCLFLIR